VKINLLNWRLDDGEIGDPYNFTENFWLDVGKYLVLKRQETDLALNNDEDTLTLFNGVDKIIDKVEYRNSFEGAAYARGQDKKWYWTIKSTPGSANEIILDKAEASVDNKKLIVKNTTNAIGGVVETTLEKVKEFEAGDNIRVSGIVAVLPNILGSQFFYIVGSPGLQIYNYKKDFPELAVGDYITVVGELSVVSGEYRLKTKSAADIKIKEKRAVPQPLALECEKVTEDITGQLITITGEIVEVKGSSIYLDDGTNEALVYVKNNTGINMAQFKAGKFMNVTGIVNRTTSGARILPRSPADIVIKDNLDKGKVLGETAVSDEWTIAQRDKKIELLQYLLVLVGAVVAVLVFMMIKYKKEKEKPGAD
jgi:DNA/RNA endonuclease YhcR with UshA esterase domain